MKETTENKSKLESAVFKAEYQEILSTSISPSNIRSFYERALERLIALTEKTIKKYKARNPKTHLVGKELEDTAYAEAGLQDVASTLDVIQQRQDQLHSLQSHIETELHVSSEVFIPPSDEHKYAIQAGSGRGLEEKLIFPRLLTLLYILENDLGIQTSLNEEGESDVEVTKGSVTDSMMRTQPYVRVIIPELKRIVYLCDEEGNATFIFDQEVIETEGISIETLDATNKALFEDLFLKHPKLGTRIIYSARWRSDMLDALSGDFIQSERPKENKNIESSKPKSDFTVRVEVPRKKEGWESAKSLSTVVHSAPDSVKKLAESFKLDHSEWFEVQRTRGIEAEHYHPELVRLIKENFALVPMKKEGWESAKSLSTVVHFSPDTIKKLAESFKSDHPKWFEVQKNGKHKIEHYHPELVRLIKENLALVPQKKEGWESANALCKTLYSTHNVIKEYAESFKSDHPKWFEVQKPLFGPVVEHYHPELVRLIKENLALVPQKKEGWESASSLSTVVHSDRNTIKKLAESFKSDHPKWFEVQKNGKHKIEHYHPELVRLITEHFEKKRK